MSNQTKKSSRQQEETQQYQNSSNQAISHLGRESHHSNHAGDRGKRTVRILLRNFPISEEWVASLRRVLYNSDAYIIYLYKCGETEIEMHNPARDIQRKSIRPGNHWGVSKSTKTLGKTFFTRG